MRVARVLAVTSLVLGGLAGCNDHNPNVVFPTDAGVDGKTEAGAPQDAGTSHDGAAAAEVATAADVGTQGTDARLAADVTPDANQGIDVASPVDASVDHAVDANGAINSPAPVDGSGLVVDGSGGSALDVGVDLSASFDGDGAGG
jgi:hypothetical protein